MLYVLIFTISYLSTIYFVVLLKRVFDPRHPSPVGLRDRKHHPASAYWLDNDHLDFIYVCTFVFVTFLNVLPNLSSF
jgi:hypothetical protein